ncbi:MAG TPA: TonB-dependent receptor [Gammaproteobacteria bacterium]|nr:TonB-dependent receptor [Gammaproteobacteria bacterium]
MKRARVVRKELKMLYMKYWRGVRWIGLMVLAFPAYAAETVIVTATRTAEMVDETLAPVTVITRKEIEDLQASSVADVLRTVPGVILTNNGGLGQATSLFLRGTNSGHVIVLVDGVRVGSATLGTTPFELIPLAQVEKIEIVRGPRSSLYGANAIGGVIQIFTRPGAANKTMSAKSSLGTDGFRELTAGFVSNSKAGISVRFSHLGSDGFDACTGAAGGCYVDEPDRDGHEKSALAVRFDRQLSTGAELGLHFMYSNADTDYDGSFSNQTETAMRVIGGRLVLDPSTNWRSTVAVGQSLDGAEDFKDRVFSSRFETLRNSLSWQNDVALGSTGLLTAGVDYQNDTVDSDTVFAVTSRDNTGVFIQYQKDVERYGVQWALRYDDNEQFGDYTTGSVTLGVDRGKDQRATVFYGTAFKAPTFNDLYYPSWGSPVLEPEESNTVDLGYRVLLPDGRWTVNVFQTNIDELIAYDPIAAGPANIDQAQIRGVEVGLAMSRDAWRWSSALTLLDTEQKSGANRGRELPRRPSEALFLNISRDLGRYGTGMQITFNGKTYDDLANTSLLDRYVVVDLVGHWKMTDNWWLNGKIKNVFDEDYETAAYYRQPGIGCFVSVSYKKSE